MQARPRVERAARGRHASRAPRKTARTDRPTRADGTSVTRPSCVLVIDVGGTSVKLLATGEAESRKFPSGRELTPNRLVARVQQVARDWRYEGVSIGFPGITGRGGPVAEPGNLGKGWVGFDFAAAFGCPVKIANDAAMQ